MSAPSSDPEWTLTANHTHGDFGQRLVGCRVKETPTEYLFIGRDGKTLARSPLSEFPAARVNFEPFNYHGLTEVSITMNVPVAAGTNWTGLWSCTGSPPIATGPQSGDFTAQAGSGLGEDEIAN